ncbi:hypothetical protein H2198_004376 [Neophaeococcomyces mojaviensis]|uniref:Uncharacterized protein n=1 Tax=Neophaeococcomyces mojaviensis TaxID=3383035 RepID=A0ACC3A990_9EURO|nr:hypothetical protein H2198_004376 [Knufia sp. JES_112]
MATQPQQKAQTAQSVWNGLKWVRLHPVPFDPEKWLRFKEQFPNAAKWLEVQRDDASDVSMDLSDDEDTIPADQSSMPSLRTTNIVDHTSSPLLASLFSDRSISPANSAIHFFYNALRSPPPEVVKEQRSSSNSPCRQENDISIRYHFIHKTEILQARYLDTPGQDDSPYLLSGDQIQALGKGW